MACPQCGHSNRVRKSLLSGKSDRPDECRKCGAELTKVDRSLLQKGENN